VQLQNVTLEMSLKPFRSMEEADIREVCRKAFTQWLPLIDQAAGSSVMLWTADGSEILDYRGSMDDELEWARYIGGANPRAAVPGDPEGICLHSRPYLYMQDPPTVTYGDLRRIVRTLKGVGAEVTGKPVRVGATFDPGPEFAKSSFKYERHPEICLAGTMGRASFACCYATLKGDDVAYAGYPDGIPDGTPLGAFLGRQCTHFLRDLGFDYIWLSNGFGFGLETWATTGTIFDGERFHPQKVAETRDSILGFWEAFRRECPGFPIETRGTNLTTGIDLASDAVPLREIYEGGFGVAPPPNSPWAALNGDFGFELVGYMSHIARVPGDAHPLRYYVHDPWWLNSPWLDRYGREPHDIYLPLSVSRVDDAGEVKTASAIELLTIDDSYGQMPDQCPQEVMPHLLSALRDAPDQPGPVVWVYPFDEYHDMTFSPEPRLEEVFFGDWFLRAAVNDGFPLNTVTSTRALLPTLTQRPELYRGSVLTCTLPDDGSPLAPALMNWVQSGGRVLFYGPAAHADPRILELVNVALAEPLAGEMQVQLAGDIDVLAAGSYPTALNHRKLLCGGGKEGVPADAADPYTEVIARVSQGGSERLAAVYRSAPQWQGGAVGWVRGTNSNHYNKGGHLLTPDDPSRWFQAGRLMRQTLARFGYVFSSAKRRPGQRDPLTCVARHDNGFFLSGYTPDTTVELRLLFPQGAPLLVGYETELVGGAARYRMPRAWHRECRVFVRQQDGEPSCVEQHSGEIGIRRRLLVRGLQDADVLFFPETHAEGKVTGLVNGAYPYIQGDFVQFDGIADAAGPALRARNVSGSLLISW